jgi:predicted RNA-binding Zn ribbon-like protein
MDNQYDFESGELCLDFANTNDWHASENPQERLHDYSDLISWGEGAGILSADRAERLRRLAARLPEEASAAYEHAIELREALFRLFSAISNGDRVDRGDLAILNTTLDSALGHQEITTSPDGFAWSWDDDPDLERVVWPVARSAADLLTSDLQRRVRRCEDDRGCGYLFIDTSRNRSRRWCSMESCGNRAKARRHYARQKDHTG